MCVRTVVDRSSPRIDRTPHSVADNLPGDFTTQPTEPATPGALRAAGVMGPVNRFFCIASDREDESGSDTESVQQVRRPRRLRLRWRSSVEQPDVVVPEVPNVVNVTDNLGARAAHVSAHREVRAARGLVQQLASKIGSVGSEGMLPRRDPATEMVVLDWLIEVASPIVEPIAFHGGNINPGAAIQTGLR